jgi:hypothetical protein
MDWIKKEERARNRVDDLSKSIKGVIYGYKNNYDMLQFHAFLKES